MPEAPAQPAQGKTQEALSIGKARQGFVLNVGSNFFMIAINATISIVLAPYLIRNLGVAAYGMVALANSFPSYIRLIMTSLSNSLVRFISVSASKGDMLKANMYYNTAFRSLVVLALLFLIPSALLSWFLPNLFDIPAAFEVQTQWLVFIVLIGCLIGAVSAPLQSIFVVHHRFFQLNCLMLVARLMGLVVLVLCFTFTGVSLVYVGLNQMVFLAASAVLFFFVGRRFQTHLRLQRGAFQKDALHEVGQLGSWVLLNNIAVLLYLAAGVAVVNVELGAKASGYFGPILLINSLLLAASGAINNVLMPVFYSYVAQDNVAHLARKFYQAVRLMMVALGAPLVLICGLAKPILSLWVGPDFVPYWPLLWMVTISMFFGGIIFLPASHIYRGKNRMKFPAICNVTFGVVHVLLTIALIRLTDLGLLSFGISFAITFGVRGVLLNALYSTHLIQQSPWKLLGLIVRLTFVLGGLIAGTYWLGSKVDGVVSLIVIGIAVSLCYAVSVFVLLLHKEDRRLLYSFLTRKRMEG